MKKISQLLLYPVKSLGAISVSEAIVEERGFRHDRRFMLVEPVPTEGAEAAYRMMTQRAYPSMALIDVAIDDDTLRVWHRNNPADVLTVPLLPADASEPLPVRVWESPIFEAQPVNDQTDAWFSRVLQTPCRLVYMPDTTSRTVTSTYRPPAGTSDAPVVSFADGFPYLLASTESLAELNRRLDEPVGIGRFRPNIVVDGAEGPHDEDTWAHFQIGAISFFGVKPCVRCVMTTIDPRTAQKGKEPLKTLATYRQTANKILFGQNVMVRAGVTGLVRVGDSVEVLERMETWI